MSFQQSFIIFLILTFTFNITEFECDSFSNFKNKTLMFAPAMITEFPLGISDVFDDASDVFRKVLAKIVSKKKLVGLDSGWYW